MAAGLLFRMVFDLELVGDKSGKKSRSGGENLRACRPWGGRGKSFWVWGFQKNTV
jgi:hypothetical protein